jgi:ABC-type dipeptide/oligopeptide/nickel transport system permease component
LFALLVGVPLGAFWSRRRRLGGLVARPFVYLALGVVPIWSALMLSYYLGYDASLVPIAGYCDLLPQDHGCGGPVDWAYHLVLPSITFGPALAAVYAGVTHRLIGGVLRAADDAPEDRKAAARRARIALGKLALRHTAWLIGATFLIEALFNFEGFGWYTITAYNLGDPTLGEAVLLAASIAAIGLSLTVDLVVGAFVADWRLNELAAGRSQDVPHWALT